MPADPSSSSSGEESDIQTDPGPHMALYIVMQGMYHFVARPRLWAKVICPIIVSLLTTVTSLSLLLIFALKPQADLFHRLGWPSWVAWFTAVLAVLAECALANLIVMLVLFAQVQSQIFRSVLEEHGVLEHLRSLHGQEELPEQCCLRDVGHSLVFLLVRLPLLIITLPLHAFPIAGQILWVSLNGWLYAWELEAEFMVMFKQLYGCGKQYRFVKDNCSSFFTFGAAAMALELIPLFGPWIFFASNACAAAYLAEEIMRRSSTPPRLNPPMSPDVEGANGGGDAQAIGCPARHVDRE